MTDYNLNLNVKINAPDLAAAYAAVATILGEVKGLGDITKVDLQESKGSLIHGHKPGCRQVDGSGRVLRGESCTCGPVPR